MLTANDHAVEITRRSRERAIVESNYILYKSKREEARIQGALDRNRIASVTIAETASSSLVPMKKLMGLLPRKLYFILMAMIGFAEAMFGAWRTINQLTASFALYFLTINIVKDRAMLRKLLWALTFALSIPAAYSLIQRLWNSDWHEEYSYESSDQYQSLVDRGHQRATDAGGILQSVRHHLDPLVQTHHQDHAADDCRIGRCGSGARTHRVAH